MEYTGNGEMEQQAEYTEEYQAEYVESAEYQELVGLGIDEQVARGLDELFQAGEYLDVLIGSWKMLVLPACTY